MAALAWQGSSLACSRKGGRSAASERAGSGICQVGAASGDGLLSLKRTQPPPPTPHPPLKSTHTYLRSAEKSSMGMARGSR
jgi:hypothetical protein